MNYAELVAELANRTKFQGFTLRAAQYVTQAETELTQHFRPFEYEPITTITGGSNNWLLLNHPEIYIAAVLKQFYLEQLDGEKAASAAQYLQSLVDRKKIADRTLRYSGERPAIPGDHP